MNTYTADFSHIDDENIIYRFKKYPVEAHSILEAAIIIRAIFHVIRIRSIIENESNVIKNFTLYGHITENQYRQYNELTY